MAYPPNNGKESTVPACQGQSQFVCGVGSSIGIIGFSGQLKEWELTLVNDFCRCVWRRPFDSKTSNINTAHNSIPPSELWWSRHIYLRWFALVAYIYKHTNCSIECQMVHTRKVCIIYCKHVIHPYLDIIREVDWNVLQYIIVLRLISGILSIIVLDTFVFESHASRGMRVLAGDR